MNVAIVVVTQNRLEYTKKTIARLLEDPAEEFDLYLLDNATTNKLVYYIRLPKWNNTERSKRSLCDHPK